MMSSLTNCFPLPMKILVLLQILVLITCGAMTDDLYDEDTELETKRQSSLSSDCVKCLAYNDHEFCTRCLNSKSPIPYNMAKREFLMSRAGRGSGCGCCAMSRSMNNHCCKLCRAAKRGIY